MSLIRIEAAITAQELLKAVEQLSPQEFEQFASEIRKLEACRQPANNGGAPVARSIEDELEELARAVPDEEWDKLPADLTDQLDHYIYGTPKR